MLPFRVQITFFQIESDIYQEFRGLTMGSPLSPVMANTYMEYFAEMAIGTSPLKQTVWLRHVDDTFTYWQHEEAVQILMDHVTSMKVSIQFTMDEENNYQLAFSDILIAHTEDGFKPSVYLKSTFIRQ